MDLFARSFSLTSRTRIVDLGGAPETWCRLKVRPRVTLVNLDSSCLNGDLESVVADALVCPFSDERFDVVFSNSLIEHLGSEQRQRVFAAEVRRLSKSGYFVQTPNKWFPIEPHFLAPFVHLLPERFRPSIVRWMTPWGWLTRPSRERCIRVCREIRLLDAREIKCLFPEAEIVEERFLGITKSFIAISQSNRSARSART
jgi:methyltransferase family protein